MVATALLAGCAAGPGPVDVDAEGVSLSPDEQRTCRDLLDALPRTVDSAERRDVRPADAPAAAWGDPPIVLHCGVAMPSSYDDFASCQETNGVGWYIPEEQLTGEPRSITMTTIGRAVNVQVALPADHWPPANAMVDLAGAITKTVEETDPCV